MSRGGGETGGGQTEEPGSGQTEEPGGGEVTVTRTLKISEGTTTAEHGKNVSPLEVTFTSGETLVFSGGVNTKPAYYKDAKSSDHVRLYGGGTLTINGSGKSISNISITFTQTANNTFSADTGTITIDKSANKGTWNAGETKPSSVVLTQSGSSGHYRISEIVITYGGTGGGSSGTGGQSGEQGGGTGGQTGETISVASVSFSPNAIIISAGTTVSFSSTTTNAEIYYSTKDVLNSSNYSTATKGSSYTIPADTSETSIKISAIAVLTAADKTYFSSASSKTYTISKTGEIPSGGQGSGTDNTPLLLGNPTNATKDATNRTNYLMEKTTANYTLSYNDETHNPNWVAWHLDSSDLGNVSRPKKNFSTDEELPEGFYRVTHDDYTNSGFDRGHMCPNADRNKTTANEGTFIMTNIVPQNHENNAGPWQNLEEYLQGLAKNQKKECYIISGPYGKGGTNKDSEFKETIGPNIQVPASTWKIVVVLDNGDDDLRRINENTTVIAINIPNRQDVNQKSKFTDYIVTVDELEKLTGYDFFSALDSELQKVLQSKKYSN